MPKHSRMNARTTRRRKMRGGGDVMFGVGWKAGGKEVKDQDFIDYVKRMGLGAEAEEEVISELTDEVELHVERAGYKSAKVPLRGGVPSTLGTVMATFDGQGEPPAVPKFDYVVQLPTGKKLRVSATFFAYRQKTSEEAGPGVKGGAHKKGHTRRHRV